MGQNFATATMTEFRAAFPEPQLFMETKEGPFRDILQGRHALVCEEGLWQGEQETLQGVCHHMRRCACDPEAIRSSTMQLQYI